LRDGNAPDIAEKSLDVPVVAVVAGFEFTDDHLSAPLSVRPPFGLDAIQSEIKALPLEQG
jgi:hypothetical protein